MKRLLALALLLAAAEPASAQLDALNSRFERRKAGGGAFPAAVVSTRPHPAVCRIIVPNRDGTSFGTGTLVDIRGKHGLVLTNWHVVHEASGPIEVVFPDGFRTPGHVHKVDKDWDLAALAVYRPTASPVTLSHQVPREGDPLTIAGYGQGDYRAVTGRCLQFLAPSDNQPFEILELGAAARQGDSGGPIFNSRGELAGVLFGEGDGRTCGSHCGRVGRFLAGVLPGGPGGGPSDSLLAARPPMGTGSMAAGSQAASSGMVHEDPLEPVGGSSLGGGVSALAASAGVAPTDFASTTTAASTPYDPLSPATELAETTPAPSVMSAPESNTWGAPDTTPTVANERPVASAPLVTAPPPGAIVAVAEPASGAVAETPAAKPGPAWLHSPAVEITKNVLAGVGVLAIFGHLLRALFAKKPAAKKAAAAS